MFLKWLLEDSKKAKEKRIKSIEDDLYYLYGYSRKQISRMSESNRRIFGLRRNWLKRMVNGNGLQISKSSTLS